MTTPIASPVQDPTTLAWTYPDAWTPDQRAAWEHSTGELVHVRQAMETAVTASAAALATPEALLAETRMYVSEAKRTTDRLRRSTAGSIAWYMASAQHGPDVMRLDSEEGDVVIMLFMTPPEIDHANERAWRLLREERAKVGADADDKTRAAAEVIGRREHEKAHLDEVLRKCTVGGLPPAESLARLRYLTGRYSGLTARLLAMRDALVMGYRAREEKDFAP